MIVALVVSAAAVQFILTGLIPFATALITKAQASDRVKAAVSAVLAAVVTLIVNNQTDTGEAILSSAVLLDWFWTIIGAGGAYRFLWKPLLDINSKLVPRFGLGK